MTKYPVNWYVASSLVILTITLLLLPILNLGTPQHSATNGTACIDNVKEVALDPQRQWSYKHDQLMLYTKTPNLTNIALRDIQPTPPSLEAPNALWNRTYGGLENDEPWCIIECGDGGFIISGFTQSFGAGLLDMWLIRIDANGNHLWNHTYGGISADAGTAILECSDGGFAIAGQTISFSVGMSDMWLVRIDTNGNHLWNHTYGDVGDDGVFSLVELQGGGFVCAGTTSSYGAGDYDVWLVRTDANGNHLWNHTYGGVYSDVGYNLIAVNEGGFVIAGLTKSFGAGEEDLWLVRTDANGNHLWNHTYGGVYDDVGTAILECSDGGFAITGQYSFNAGEADLWLVRTDANGNPLWNYTYGGSGNDLGRCVISYNNDSYICFGYTQSFGVGGDMCLLRVSDVGQLLWNVTYGGIDFDAGNWIVECRDGGFALAGQTKSFGAGKEDVWLIRVPLPKWGEVPENQVIEFGERMVYDLNATSICGIDRWWLNDTVNFDVSPTGIITDLEVLHVGAYGLQVCVNDTLGNTLSNNFTVWVQDNTSPTWIIVPTDQTLMYNSGLDYQVPAWDLSGIDYWTLNDTDHFSLSAVYYGVASTAQITNTSSLTAGFYGLNITVYDLYHNGLNAIITINIQELEQDTKPPTWIIPPAHQELEYGTAFALQLAAWDPSGIDHWMINDTTHFAIDGTGLITSLQTLAVGSYGLNVTVYDTYGNHCSATFTITIEYPSTPPIPNVPLSIALLLMMVGVGIGALLMFGFFLIRQERRKS